MDRLDDNPLRIRGKCVICGKFVYEYENFAVLFSEIPPKFIEGIAHEECLDKWQRPMED